MNNEEVKRRIRELNPFKMPWEVAGVCNLEAEFATCLAEGPVDLEPIDFKDFPRVVEFLATEEYDIMDRYRHAVKESVGEAAYSNRWVQDYANDQFNPDYNVKGFRDACHSLKAVCTAFLTFKVPDVPNYSGDKIPHQYVDFHLRKFFSQFEKAIPGPNFKNLIELYNDCRGNEHMYLAFGVPDFPIAKFIDMMSNQEDYEELVIVANTSVWFVRNYDGEVSSSELSNKTFSDVTINLKNLDWKLYVDRQGPVDIYEMCWLKGVDQDYFEERLLPNPKIREKMEKGLVPR